MGPGLDMDKKKKKIRIEQLHKRTVQLKKKVGWMEQFLFLLSSFWREVGIEKYQEREKNKGEEGRVLLLFTSRMMTTMMLSMMPASWRRIKKKKRRVAAECSQVVLSFSTHISMVAHTHT